MGKYTLIVTDTGNDIGTLTGQTLSLGVLSGSGPKGDGWTGVSYDTNTGRFTFTSNDGLGYVSDDITVDLDAAVAAAAASETAAATSESNAATSETNAATSASNAATSETNASASASAAASSASSASTSASNAATSASAASSAQSAAESARDATLAAYDNFDDRYLGAKASDPTLDNDGNALVAGSIYFNSTAGQMRIYTGSAWVAAYVDGANYLALSGGSMTGNLSFGDNDKAIFGAGSDLQIYHDSASGQSIIHENGPSVLKIRATDFRLSNADNTADYLSANNGAEVSIRYNGAVKLATTSTGIDVTGTVTADGLTVETAAGISGTIGILRNSSSAAAGNAAYLDFKFDNTFSGNNVDVQVGAIKTNAGNEESAFVVKTTSGTGTPTERFRIDASGNVGIGTTSPNAVADLHVSDTSDTRIWLEATSGDTMELYSGTGVSLFNRSNSYLMLGTNNTERMRIDSNGNVGIGTSSPAHKLEVSGDVKAANGLFPGIYGTYLYEGASNAFNIRVGASGPYAEFVDAGSGVLEIGNAGGVLALTASGTERMRIDSSGNVGIGTSSPAKTLHLNEAAGTNTVLHMTNSTTGTTDTDGFSIIVQETSNDAIISQREAANLVFRTSDTERMRIDSGGNVMVGRTSSQNGNSYISFETDNINKNGIWTHNSSTTTGVGSGTYVATCAFNSSLDTSGFFYDAASNWPTSFNRKFAVRKDGAIFSTITYISSLSDQRIKQNIVDATDGLNIITALRPVRFDYKPDYNEGKTNQLGFVAQEAEAVFPDMVDCMFDMIPDGETEPLKTVGTAALIPVLVKAIQEQQEIITALETRIAALEG